MECGEDGEDNEEGQEVFTSQLGTKDFWDHHYKVELSNYKSFGGAGTVWFGDSVENRIVQYIITNKKLQKDSMIIDLGCGNGSLLRKLRRSGFSKLFGVDYCKEAIDLADELSETERKRSSDNLPSITVKNIDLMSECCDLEVCDVVLDKGTWDALSLNVDRDNRLACYKITLRKITRTGSSFIICSCNFTRGELCSSFADEFFSFMEEIPSKNVFEYGGSKGATTSCVVFTRI